MARRKAPDSESDERGGGDGRQARSRWRRPLLAAGWAVGTIAVLLGVFWVTWQGETFLIHDARFGVAARGLDEEDEAIRVSGAKRASKAAVLDVFEPDRGRSLYEVEPEKRRLQLRGVEWVRDAAVRRVWPNRIEVEIYERSPVAFIQVPDGASGDFNNPVKFKPMLIDAEGVRLTPHGAVPQSLPLLTGLRAEGDVEIRRQQVALMLRFLRAVRQHKSKIVEVDVREPNNLRAGVVVNGHTFLLTLGRELYFERLELFLKEYESMREQLEAHREYDLTNENRIVIVDPEGAPGAARR